ncbi:MAG: TIGR04013 family B12-binding domain/radical SAM domain-containing protein, partial [Nitrospirae bacterium]
TDIRFISPNAFSYGSSDGIRLNIEALEILLKGIRGILGRDGRIFFGTFPSEVRPEHVRPETLELIKRYCDNDNIVIGAQSGSERVLKALRRGHAVEDVKRAVRLCKDYGIKVNVDFIFGLPEETEKDQMDTVKLMQEVVEYGARVHAHYFMPLPGTPLQDAMASPLSDKLLQAIKGLLPTGRLFGQWAKQREFTEKLLKRRSQYVSETAD